jgi:hypothetical protein
MKVSFLISRYILAALYGEALTMSSPDDKNFMARLVAFIFHAMRSDFEVLLFYLLFLSACVPACLT